MWPFINSQSAAQVMTLNPTFVNTPNSSNHQQLAHNFDINLFAAAAALHQQQQQQQHQHHHQQQQHQRKPPSFQSPFSVNSLLAPFVSSTIPQAHNSQLQTTKPLPNNVMQQQQQATNTQQHQQLAAAVFTQHIAAAVANYRIHQQKLQQQQQQQALLNDSAFQPPNKRLKMDSANYESYSISSPSSSTSSLLSSSTTASLCDFNHELNNNLDKMNNQEMHSESNCTSLSSSLLNDSTYDLHNEQQRQDRNTPDNIKNSSFVRRSSRKRNSIDLQNPCCPICGLSLRLNDLQAHIDLELEKLEKLTNGNNSNLNSSNNNMHINNNNNNCSLDTPSNHNNQLTNISNNFSTNRKRTSSGSERILSCSSSSSYLHQNETNYKSRYLNYLRIKENRQARLKSKLRIRVRETANGTLICPICIEPLKGTKNEINLHLENCTSSSRTNSSSDGEKDIDVETTGPSTSSIHEVFEEYEWAGQKRIRTISLLNDPAKELGAVNVKNEEFDGELNVDSDEHVISYGKSQFNESDIIPIQTDDSSVEILRKAVIDGNSNNSNNNNTENEDNNQNTDTNEASHDSNEDNKPNNDNSKCLICMEPYTNALVSVNCWHVYCKQCWLQSLGAKKLCPQCNVITTAEDLRRIFL